MVFIVLADTGECFRLPDEHLEKPYAGNAPDDVSLSLLIPVFRFNRADHLKHFINKWKSIPPENQILLREDGAKLHQSKSLIENRVSQVSSTFLSLFQVVKFGLIGVWIRPFRSDHQSFSIALASRSNRRFCRWMMVLV
jgi:hypothetical protein